MREDPTHSTLVLIEQVFALHGFTLNDIEAWGGRLITCGGPGDVRRRLEPLARGELDAVFDEGIKVWLNEALAAGLVPVEFDAGEYDAIGQARLAPRGAAESALSRPWRRMSTPSISAAGRSTASASLAEQTAYDICGALAAREVEIPFEKGTNGNAMQMVQETDMTPMDVPLHPGAERWLREQRK